MTPIEAMEWAADYAERAKIFTAPKNDRGYIRDGWKEPSPAERAMIIADIARTVIETQAPKDLDAAKGSFYLTKVAQQVGNLADYLDSSIVGSSSFDQLSTSVRATRDALYELRKELESA